MENIDNSIKYKITEIHGGSVKAANTAILSESVSFVLQECDCPSQFNMTYVSEKLAMSTRTLSRKLQKEGTNFKAILDAEKKALCMELMENGMYDALDLAVNLGFSDPSNFCLLYTSPSPRD